MTVWLGARDPSWIGYAQRPLRDSRFRLRTRILSLPVDQTGRFALFSTGRQP